MKKSEIKKIIEGVAANLNSGEYALNFDATAAVYGGKIPYAATESDFAETDFEGYYEGEDGEEYAITAAVIAKDEEGEVSVIVDNGSCYPPTYTIKDFAEKYGE